MEDNISVTDKFILNIFANIDENGNYIIKGWFNAFILKSYFQLKSVFVKKEITLLSLSELSQWLKDFKKECEEKKFCISLGKVTAADIQLLHPELIEGEGVEIESNDGFVIHLAYDSTDKLMKKWGEKFRNSALNEISKHYLTVDGVPCYVIDCGDDYEKLIKYIGIIDSDIIDSKKTKFEVDFWFY